MRRFSSRSSTRRSRRATSRCQSLRHSNSRMPPRHIVASKRDACQGKSCSRCVEGHLHGALCSRPMKTGIASLFLLATIFSAGDAAAASKSGKSEVWPVKEGQAQIVLVRNSNVSWDQPTFLYETTSGQPKYLRLISNKRKFVLDLPPGDHVLMIGKMPLCDFMPVSVLPGKRYYAVVVARW